MRQRDRIRNAMVDRVIDELRDQDWRKDAVVNDVGRTAQQKWGDMLQQAEDEAKPLIEVLEKLRTPEDLT